MLILTRQAGQSIMVGDDITITILGSNGGGQVKVGISAPKDVPVHREEIYIKVKSEEQAEGKKELPHDSSGGWTKKSFVSPNEK